jgi:cytochrome c peroxidase
MRGQTPFFGKAQCATCHTSLYYLQDTVEFPNLIPELKRNTQEKRDLVMSWTHPGGSKKCPRASHPWV